MTDRELDGTEWRFSRGFRPHPSWESARFALGQIIKFRNSRALDDVREGMVIGYDTQDRLLVDYPSKSGTMFLGASIHVSVII